MKKLIESSYVYEEGWQKQTIQIDPISLIIIRKQNHFNKNSTEIVWSEDIIDVHHRDWYYLFKKYCYTPLRRYYEETD